MKSEPVISVFRAFLDGDRDRAVSVMRQIVASEETNGNATIARRISRLIDNGRSQMIRLPNAPDSVAVVNPSRDLESLVLADGVSDSIRAVSLEWKHRERLALHGLAARNVIMLYGPSGNGKTVLGEAVAKILGLPLALVRYENLIDSHMGESGKNLSGMFKFARETPCVLFVDEADSLVTRRVAGSGAGGAGTENNRLTNAMLIELDRLGASSCVIFATNMRGDLDPALSRRLSVELELGPPQNGQREKMIAAMNGKWPMIRGGTWEREAGEAESFARIESLAMDAARSAVLAGIV